MREVNIIEGESNPFFINGLADHYNKKYIFNLPLWTNYFGYRVDPLCQRDSNANGEAFFHLVNNLQANKERHIRIPRRIEFIKTICEGGLRKIHVNSIGVLASNSVIEKQISSLEKSSPSSTKP